MTKTIKLKGHVRNRPSHIVTRHDSYPNGVPDRVAMQIIEAFERAFILLEVSVD